MKVVYGCALFAVFASCATASPYHLTVSEGRSRMSVHPDGFHFAAPLVPPKGLAAVFDNLGSKYPDGVYFCCDGLSVSGPDTDLGQQVWPAIAFTPATDVTVKVVDAAVGYNGGANDVVISIATDSGGLPGSFLGSTHVTGLSNFGDCCGLARAKFSGIRLKAGQQYWVVVGTDSEDTTAVAAWSFNSTEQIQTVRFAENYGKGWQLINVNARPAPAFAVYGK